MNTTSLTQLPPDIKLLIASSLPIRERHQLAQTSKDWNNLIYDKFKIAQQIRLCLKPVSALPTRDQTANKIAVSAVSLFAGMIFLWYRQWNLAIGIGILPSVVLLKMQRAYPLTKAVNRRVEEVAQQVDTLIDLTKDEEVVNHPDCQSLRIKLFNSCESWLPPKIISISHPYFPLPTINDHFYFLLNKNRATVDELENHLKVFKGDIFQNEKFIACLTSFRDTCKEIKCLKRSDLHMWEVDEWVFTTLTVMGLAMFFFWFQIFSDFSYPPPPLKNLRALAWFIGAYSITTTAAAALSYGHCAPPKPEDRLRPLIILFRRYYIPLRNRLANALLG